MDFQNSNALFYKVKIEMLWLQCFKGIPEKHSLVWFWRKHWEIVSIRILGEGVLKNASKAKTYRHISSINVLCCGKLSKKYGFEGISKSAKSKPGQTVQPTKEKTLPAKGLLPNQFPAFTT